MHLLNSHPQDVIQGQSSDVTHTTLEVGPFLTVYSCGSMNFVRLRSLSKNIWTRMVMLALMRAKLKLNQS